MNTQLDKFDKEQLLDSIADGSVSAESSRNMLKQINESEFESISEEDPITSTQWTQDYFDEQLSKLKRRFSKQRAEHLIAVKKHLQEIGAKGFVVQEDNPNINLETTENIIPNLTNLSQDELLQAQEKLLQDYVPSDKLKDALMQKNSQLVQVILESNLNNYRLDIPDILQSVVYVQKAMPEIFLDYVVDKITLEINKNPEDWNKEYFYLQQSYLNHNFALYRLLHLINVRDYLAQNGVEGFSKIEVQPNKPKSSTNSKNQRPINPQNEPKQQKKQGNNDLIKTALIVGGAVLAGIVALIAIMR